MTTVADAFRLARKHAAQHMRACERARLRWGETSVTEIVTAHAARAVAVVPFTQPAETLSGADWVWWWVDSTGAYGMLVQAKRVEIRNSAWTFGFGYRAPNAARPQRDLLLATAAALDLLRTYALYLGTGDYRDWASCSKRHEPNKCPSCVRRTVSLMPALLADSTLVSDATSTYERTVALEDIWTPPSTGSLLIPSLTKQLPLDLSDFLMTSQDGTRAVARSMIDAVLRARLGTFTLATTGTTTVSDGEHDALGSVFSEYPDDTMHGGMKYFPHTLNPFRHSPPAYVREITSGDHNAESFADQMPDSVAGVVVVQLPPS